MPEQGNKHFMEFLSLEFYINELTDNIKYYHIVQKQQLLSL